MSNQTTDSLAYQTDLSSYNRLKNLVTNVGIAVADSSVDDGELYCYCVAIEKIKSAMQNVLCQVFLTELADGSIDFDRYTSLLNIDTQDKSNEQILAEIKERLSQNFGYGDFTTFEEDFKKVGSGSYTISENKITFSDVLAKDIYRLSAFVKAYTHQKITIAANGPSMTFDEWDQWGLPFTEYDSLAFPFTFLDDYNKEGSTNE